MRVRIEDGGALSTYLLKLYVTGTSPRAERAIANLRAHLRERAAGEVRARDHRRRPTSAGRRRRQDSRDADAHQTASAAAAPGDRRSLRHRESAPGTRRAAAARVANRPCHRHERAAAICTRAKSCRRASRASTSSRRAGFRRIERRWSREPRAAARPSLRCSFSRRESAIANENGVFVTFEESAADIRQNMRSFGWDLERVGARRQPCLRRCVARSGCRDGGKRRVRSRRAAGARGERRQESRRHARRRRFAGRGVFTVL